MLDLERVLERAMFYRELDDGVYPLSSYIAYKIIEEGVSAIPVSLIAQTRHVLDARTGDDAACVG